MSAPRRARWPSRWSPWGAGRARTSTSSTSAERAFPRASSRFRAATCTRRLRWSRSRTSRGPRDLSPPSPNAWARASCLSAEAMLLLFDIDGTLLHAATDAHRDAMYEAIRSVHSVDPTRLSWSIAPAGRTDPEIMRAILLAAGLSAERIDDRASDVREECCRACARADGVRCLAVATGPFGPDELGQADRVLSDARELRGALEELLVGVG